MSTTDYQFKLVLVGDAKAGKSSLLMNYVCSTFSGTYVASTGTDFKSKAVDVADGTNCKLEIWDTAGANSLQSSFSRFFRNAQAALLCYDVCNKASFQNLTKYLQQVQMNAPVDCVVYVVACKGDCFYSRKVPAAEGEKFASSRRCEFREVSGKSGAGVEALFRAVAASMLKQQLQGSGSQKTPAALLCVASPDGAGAGDGDRDREGGALGGGGEACEDGEEGEEAVQFRRSTFTEGAAGTGSRLLESAYPLYISGARSWYNSAKINGRYVPQLSRLSRFDAVEVFCYWNVDCANTVMLYSDNHWVVKRNRKELARLPSPSIECFPDEANRKTSWRENTGVYFTWMHLRPDIRCAALQASPAAAIQQQGWGGSVMPRSSASFSGSPGGALAAGGYNNSNSGAGGHRASFSDRDSLSSYSEHGTSSSASRVYRGQHGTSGGPAGQDRGGSFSYKPHQLAHVSSSNCLAGAYSTSGKSPGGGGGSGIFASILLLPLLQQDSGSSLIIINMDAFYRCSRDPQRLLGLTPLLFCQYCQLRLALLEHEYKAAPTILDSATLVKICAQSKRMQETCADLLVAAGLPSASTTGTTGTAYAPPPPGSSSPAPLQTGNSAKEIGSAPAVPATAEDILLAGKVFLKGLARQLVALCAVETGSVEQAGRCRDVKVEVESFLDELRGGGGGGAGGRGSFSMSGRASFSFNSRSSFSGSAW